MGFSRPSLFVTDCRRDHLDILGVAFCRHPLEFTVMLHFAALSRFGGLLDDHGDRPWAKVGFIDAEDRTKAAARECPAAAISTTSAFRKGGLDPHIARLQVTRA